MSTLLDIELVIAGPRLTLEDLRPYIKKNITDSLVSIVPGFVGPLRLMNKNRPMASGKRPPEQYLVVKAGKRTFTVDFSRGEGYCLVKFNDKFTVITQR